MPAAADALTTLAAVAPETRAGVAVLVVMVALAMWPLLAATEERPRHRADDQGGEDARS